MAEIEIDGKTCQAESGEMIIAVADREGIAIPRFCYHKKLSIAANCRMCLVEVEKAPKPLPACATPIADGMKVFTQSAVAREAQHAVMEFLLINHPLDCPICDQGGECELQDVALGYGSDTSHYDQSKRVVKDENIGALVETEMTRCIHCTRCVRFGEEVAGLPELGLTERGEHARIGTYVEASLKSELSGNIIDLCPVGALTSKPFRYRARAWEMTQHASLSPHDCVGTHLNVHVRRGEVMRVVPRENADMNETWLADRDRFSYLALSSVDRQPSPMIKQADGWHTVTWAEAFDFAVTGLQDVIKQHGAKQLGGLIAPHATLEELYLFQKLLRGLGSDNIDHRLHQSDFSDQDKITGFFPGCSMKIAELENCDAFLLVGSNLYREQPLLGNRLRTAVRKGAKACIVNPMAFDIHFDIATQIVTPLMAIPAQLASIAKAIASLSDRVPLPDSAARLLASIEVSEEAKMTAKTLLAGKQVGVFMGAIASNHPQAAWVRSMMHLIALLLGVEKTGFGIFTEGGNTAGAWIGSALPHLQLTAQGYQSRAGVHALQMIQNPLKAYLLFNVEPEFDCTDSHGALQAMKQADFVVHVSPFMNEATKAYADVFLPIAAFTETAGTYLNVNYVWQVTEGVAQPFGQARPGWKVLRVLANQLQLEQFDYESVLGIREEVARYLEADNTNPSRDWQAPAGSFPNESASGLYRIGTWDIYGVDNIVRRADALQAVYAEEFACLVSSDFAKQYDLIDGRQVTVKQGETSVMVPIKCDSRLAPRTVYLVSGKPQTIGLGPAFGKVEILL